MPWYAQAKTRCHESGKFRSYARVGVEKTPRQEYRDWSFEFILHQTGISVRRTCYSVAICDPRKSRAAYLRDFNSLEQATSAARKWIDKTLRRQLTAKPPASLGAIPPVPTKALVQESAPRHQEK